MSDDPAVSPLEYLPLLAPNEPQEVTKKRLRGGQPGNTNAFKHGLYFRKGSLYNTTPMERAQLNDINEVIAYFKKYIEHVYKLTITSNDIEKVNATLRSLSQASIALTRLIHTQNKNFAIHLDDDYRDPTTDEATLESYYRGILKKLSKFMDVSDLLAECDRLASANK